MKKRIFTSSLRLLLAACLPLWFLACSSAERSDCDDHIECTEDSYNTETGQCEFTPVDSVCDDGLFCNGPETCQPDVGCVENQGVFCDDGFDCTADSCDEEADSCVRELNHDMCDDGIDCTNDQCSSDSGCIFEPDHDACADDDLCNGNEVCDASEGCLPAAVPLECDDGLDCNGVETCDPDFGCVPGEGEDCDDGIDCTVDSCDPESDQCIHEVDHAVCDNGLFCDGEEVCSATAGCVDGIAPDCAIDSICSIGVCDEDAYDCIEVPDNGALCDSGTGAGSGRCFEDSCYERGCGDGLTEPDFRGEECDPGPDPDEVAGCTEFCRSVDFVVNDSLPEVDWNGNQSTEESDGAVAALSDGRFVVAWTRDIGGTCGGARWPDDYCYDDVQFRILSERGEFDTDATYSHDEAGGAQNKAAVRPFEDGFAIVWFGDILSIDARSDIFIRYFDEDGLPLSDTAVVNATDNGVENYPAFDTYSEGAAVTWFGHIKGGEFGIFLRFIDDTGTPVGDEDTLVTSDDWDRMVEPAIAISADETVALVTWIYQPGSIWEDYDDILAGRFYDVETGDALGDEFEIYTVPDTNLRNPTLVSIPDGGFYIVWVVSSGGRNRIVGRHVSNDGVLYSLSTLAPRSSDRPYSKPSIATFSDYRIVVVWEDDRDTSLDGDRRSIGGVLLEVSPIGSLVEWSSGTTFLNTTTYGNQTDPHVAISADNSLIVCFTDSERVEDIDWHGSHVSCRILPSGWLVE